MSKDHLIEDKGIRLKEDAILDGELIGAGTKLRFVLRQGTYSGFKMRLPPPEFEALLFFNAIECAAKAETLKKLLKVDKSSFDGLPEVNIESGNQRIFFSICQNAMASVAFSISAIESWSNNCIAVHGEKDGKPRELTLRRPDKPDKKVMSNSVASDLSIPIRPKLFQLIPQVFKCPELKEHSTLKKRIGDIIEDRNIVMHMQNKIVVSEEEVERVNYAVKLYKVNSFVPLETIIKYVGYVYDKSTIDRAEWVNVAEQEIYALKKKLKSA